MREAGSQSLAAITTNQLYFVNLDPFACIRTAWLRYLTVGYTRFISDNAEKNDALTRITNHAFRASNGTEGDRWADSRETSETEVNMTIPSLSFS